MAIGSEVDKAKMAGSSDQCLGMCQGAFSLTIATPKGGWESATPRRPPVGNWHPPQNSGTVRFSIGNLWLGYYPVLNFAGRRTGRISLDTEEGMASFHWSQQQKAQTLHL